MFEYHQCCATWSHGNNHIMKGAEKESKLVKHSKGRALNKCFVSTVFLLSLKLQETVTQCAKVLPDTLLDGVKNGNILPFG